jgi:predicted RNA binding protein YcfA (HicA-like mRNA interferase family)
MKLPVLSGRELLRVLGKVGFELDHTTGSHAILRRATPPHVRVTAPPHREVAKGTLRAILRQAGLNREEFKKLLDAR